MGVKKLRSSENILILDIGSGSVSTSLVHKQKNTLPEILGHVRIPFFIGDSHQTLEKHMLETLDVVLGKTLANALEVLRNRQKPSTLSSLMIVFSSPWTVSKLLSSAIVRDKNFNISMELTQEIFRVSGRGLKEELDQRYSEPHEVFESAVMSVSVDGRLQNPRDLKSGRAAEIHYSQSAISKNLVQKIENRILRHFSIERGVALQSFLYIFFKILSHSFQDLDSFAIVQFGEYTTDLLFIKNSKPALSMSLPFGSTTLASRVADTFTIELPAALSMQRLFAEGMLDAESTNRLDYIFSSVEEEWEHTWTEATSKFTETLEVSKVFVVAPHPFEGIAKTMIGNLLPKSTIILIGSDNMFTETITRSPEIKLFDEKVRLEACFSTLL